MSETFSAIDLLRTHMAQQGIGPFAADRWQEVADRLGLYVHQLQALQQSTALSVEEIEATVQAIRDREIQQMSPEELHAAIAEMTRTMAPVRTVVVQGRGSVGTPKVLRYKNLASMFLQPRGPKYACVACGVEIPPGKPNRRCKGCRKTS